MKKQSLYLVDASIYIFRSYFSMPDGILNGEGQEINALYGYALFISKFLEQAKPNHLAFAFDESLNSCFRNSIYPLYKSSRALPDESLANQLKLCRKITESVGIPCFSSKKYEADDLIGSLAEQFRAEASKVIYVTRDKDLGQLLKARDIMWNFAEDVKMSPKQFNEKFGVKPSQFIDYLALVGDKIDDIPGVKGIGEGSAQKLIKTYGSIDRVYKNIEKIPSLDIRGAKRVSNCLAEEEDQAYLSYELAKIRTDIKVAKSFSDLAWDGSQKSSKKLHAFLKRNYIQGRINTSISNAFDPLLNA